jgi:hypothetical protein
MKLKKINPFDKTRIKIRLKPINYEWIRKKPVGSLIEDD